MKPIVIFGLFIMIMVFAQLAHAQTVDDIVTKYTAAIGGSNTAAAINSIFTLGITERNGNEITIKTTRVQGKLFHNKVDFGMGTVTTIVTPEKGWRNNPANGFAMEEMTAGQLKGQLSNMECISPLFNYAVKGHKAELVGKDATTGTECWKIKLTTVNGKEINFWVDARFF
jgi:hypothetical protein